MRIGIDARMYGPESTTGIGAYIKNLTGQLFAIDQANEYVLFMREPAFSAFTPPNNRISKVRAEIPWYSIGEQLRLPGLLKKHRLDLVHFPQFNAAIFYPGRFVITVHDITPKFFPGPVVKKSLVRKIGYEIIFRTSLRRAEKIITVSGHTKENLVKHFKVPAEKIAVTYLGADRSFAPADAEQQEKIRRDFKISKPFIFYVGVWRDHKNIENLVRAFDIIRSSGQLDLQLVLGGKPDDRYPEIITAIERSRFRSDIIMPGFIKQSDLPAFYSAAKLFVLPSYCEGFGLVTLESMACGTPVAGSSTTSLPEILGEAALYFDPADPADIAGKIRLILTDNELYGRLKERGFKQAGKYDWRDCASQTLAIYQSR